MTLREIYDRAAINTTSMIPFEEIRRSMERARSLHFPRNPQNIEDMDQAIQSFRGSIGFYRGSVNWGIEKAFIFLTEHQIMLLQQCDVLFIDATFKTAPNHSYQILNFAIKHGGFFSQVMSS